MFSSRTNWDFRPSPLYELVQEMRAAGEPIVDLTESNQQGAASAINLTI
jgi:hypothetical protein